MSRLTPRLRWARAIKSDAFPQEHRVIRGTLLCLVDLMLPTGELKVWRDQMARATGLPTRTLDRHLQRAVEAGWLIRDTPAGRKRQSVYRTAIPFADPDGSVRHFWRAEDEFCAPSTRIQNGSSVRHLVANTRKESASASERVALDDQRGRRSTPVGSGVNATDDFRKDGSKEVSGLPTPLRRLSSVRTTKGEVA